MPRTVASFVIDTLIDNGMDQLYCLPGVQNDDFFDALYDKQSELSPIHTRHEQGAAYMALGAAMATGKPQAFSVVPGPGFLNATAALSTAYAVNAPVLALVGQIPSNAIGKGFGLLHEIPDQLGVLKGLTKYATRISDGSEVSEAMSTAFAALQSGRPRPVGVEVPVNVWKAPVDDNTPPAQINTLPAAAVDTDKIERAARLLSQAKRPLIIVGGGAQNSSDEITRLAELMSAPVMCYRSGQGVVAGDHALSIGPPIGHALWSQIDVVLGLGTRLQIPQMQWGTDADLQIIHIDIDDEEVGRITDPAVGIVADLAAAIPQLLQVLEADPGCRQDWTERVAETKAQWHKIYEDKLAPQLGWLRAIRAELPRNGIFLDELTQVGYVSRFAFETYEPRTFLSSGYQGTLGWGMATALGAAHARRDVPVVSITGDGGALFAIGELATAARHNIPLTTIVFNDNAFGNVRRFQIDNYNNRAIASDLKSPDFVELASSFGVAGRRATTPDALRKELKAAFNSGTATVIEVPVGEFPSPWDYILMPRVRGG
ncbi:MAG: TPP-binding protein [Gammaproteobacteria bacterium]|nr:TPP-binding protein [Gammaproteobacteria bacterium]